MPPWAYHSSVFEVTKDWQTFEINFSDFEKKSGMSPKLNPNSIRDISFAGYGRNFDVDLMITEVSFSILLSLFKSDPKIKKTTLTLEELDITQLNKLSIIIKPSNFKSLINNKIKKGKLISQIEIFLTEKGEFKDFSYIPLS